MQNTLLPRSPPEEIRWLLDLWDSSRECREHVNVIAMRAQAASEERSGEVKKSVQVGSVGERVRDSSQSSTWTLKLISRRLRRAVRCVRPALRAPSQTECLHETDPSPSVCPLPPSLLEAYRRAFSTNRPLPHDNKLTSECGCKLRADRSAYAACNADLAKLTAELDLESEQTAKNIPAVNVMMQHIQEKAPAAAHSALARFKEHNWKALNSYTYTVIAEKLHAIVTLGIANSRMKDFFDLWVLTRHSELDTTILRRAIAATFARRGTALPKNSPAWPATSGCQPSASAFDTKCATCVGVMEAADGSIPASGRVTSSSKISFEPRPDADATAMIMFDEPTAWEYVGCRRIRQIRWRPLTSIFRELLLAIAI